MKLKTSIQTQFKCIFTFILVSLLTACGGGGGDSSSTSGSSATGIQTLDANAGDIVAVRVGNTAILDGSQSTGPSALSFAWSFVSKPDLSNVILQDATSVNPSFIPDVVGSYRVQLIITAGGISSERAIALVEASVSGNYTGIRQHAGNSPYPSQCAECHDGRFIDADINPGVIPPKAGNHPSTSNICEACHTTFGFELLSFVDHQEVFDNCSICHNGVSATGKSTKHVTTVEECDVCHTTNSFLTLDANGKYDHTGITSGCDTCHNGKTAIGKEQVPDPINNPHPVTTEDCVSCHNVTTFTGAFPDHNAILANVTASTPTQACTDCHAPNSTAQDVKVGHPDMNADCVTCHGITQFSMGGVFDHRVDASVVRCDTCHTDTNTINAIGMGTFAGHLDPLGEDCGTCHGPSKDANTGLRSFKNVVIDHSSTAVTTVRCDSCHADPGTALHKKANHIDTVVDCKDCHTPGNFATGTFDHSVPNMVGLTCSGCHNGTIKSGKPVTHIPTTAECIDCHTTTTFKGATVDHSGITSNCVSCHDGVISKGKNISHLSTVRDCSVCHLPIATTKTFVGGTYDHGDPGINTNCASCHNGVTAIDKTNNGTNLNHIPSKNECSECHTTTTTGGFADKSVFMTNVHPNQISGCEGCHTAKFLSANPLVLKDTTTHIPTLQDCDSCHTNSQFKPSVFTHAGITGNCESCHSGSFFASSNAKGKAIPTPTNTHPVTSVDCGSCHAIGNNFTDGTVDHTGIVDNCASCHDGSGASTTKLSIVPSGSHISTTQDCSICHTPGTFKTTVFNHNQIVNDCASCHDGSGASTTKLSIVPANSHVNTAEDCSVCHNTTAFAGAKYDHTGITTNCASCHDGLVALGKDGTHVPTSDDCSVCHLTTGMKPATFTHTGIVSNCVSCHDGILATGKTPTHVTTASDCGSCHTVPPTTIIANGPTNGWIPAGFDHSGVSINTRCDSCHGVTSTPKSTNHWLTNSDCRDCHVTSTFIGATWKHDSNSAGNCDSCHNNTTPAPNGGARAKSNTHMSTTLQCDSCHSTTAFAPLTFKHDPNDVYQARYPGDHRVARNCVDCHGNSVVRPFVYRDIFTPVNACAACHKNDFRRKGDHIGGENGTVEQNKDCSGGGRGCHRVGDSSF